MGNREDTEEMLVRNFGTDEAKRHYFGESVEPASHTPPARNNVVDTHKTYWRIVVKKW